MGDRGGADRVLGGDLKDATWKTRRKWEDNIKMYLQEMG
jgi:hypothetical protein